MKIKRGRLLITLTIFTILILNLFLISAQQNTKEEIEKTTEGIESATKGLGSQINEKIAQEIELPEWLQILAKIIFGIKEEKIVLYLFVIHLAVFVLIFFIIYRTSIMLPFLTSASEILKLFFSLIVSLLVSLAGGIRAVVVQLYGLATLFKAIENIPALATAIAIIIVMIVMWSANILMKYLTRKSELAKAEVEGEEAGTGLKLLTTFRRTIKEK